MEYITRDLQHKTKEILDKALSAPVRIRRGSEFFEITKVKTSFINTSEESTKVYHEPEIVEDNQEWEDVPFTPTPVNYSKPGKSLDDLLAEGLIKNGA